MTASRRIEGFGLFIAFFVAAAILLVGLGRHGIWDPTELGFADAVRSHGAFAGKPPWHGVLVALGFQRFGIADWSGRVFGALAALGAVVSAMGIARRHFDARAAGYAAIAAVASPLVVLNARWMIGDGGAIGAQALFGLAVFVASFEGNHEAESQARARIVRTLAMLAIVPLGVVAVMLRGALLGVMPPLLAVLAVTLLEPRAASRARVARYLVSTLALVMLIVVVVAVVRDRAMYSVVLGGVPGGESPPPFEKFLQIAFHTLAPWSPIFVLGAARTLAPSSAADADADADAGSAWRDPTDRLLGERSRVRIALVLWAVFAFGAATLFASRYGAAGFFAVVPVAVLAAVTLREAEVGPPLELAAIIVAVMLLALVLRDFALYPGSPLAAVAVPAPTLGTDFQPRKIWAALFLGFAAAFALGAASRMSDGWGPVRTSWRASLARAAGTVRARPMVIASLAALGLVELVMIVGAFAGPSLGLATIGIRVTRALSVGLPLGLVVATFGTNVALRAFSKLGGARMLPAVLAGLALGAYVQGPFLVELSGDLSPREVYATYTRLHQRGEQLVEFDIASRAAAYYVGNEVRTVANQAELVTHLAGEGRRWAMFKRNVLPEIDRRFRTATGRHIVIADARNLEVVLATNRPIPGRRDENPLTNAVRSGQVRPQHPVAIRFEEVELVGYDLELPNGTSVGAGQSFRVTWYWKVLRAPTRDWRIFLHVDGAGLRLNGDHDPVEGLLPTRQWSVGDTVADTQELSVPPSYPATDFTFYIGFYQAEQRMPIVSGNHTPDNRAIAGTLEVR